jgi:hypothetical protein
MKFSIIAVDAEVQVRPSIWRSYPVQKYRSMENVVAAFVRTAPGPRKTPLTSSAIVSSRANRCRYEP